MAIRDFMELRRQRIQEVLTIIERNAGPDGMPLEKLYGIVLLRLGARRLWLAGILKELDAASMIEVKNNRIFYKVC